MTIAKNKVFYGLQHENVYLVGGLSCYMEDIQYKGHLYLELFTETPC